MSAAKWGAVVLAVVAGVGSAALVAGGRAPEAAPEPAPVASRPVHRPPARPRRHEPRELVRSEPRMPRDARAEVREATRSEQADALLLEIEDHAVGAGWEPELIAAVEDEIVATTNQISEELGRVDRGEVRWEEVRGPIRDARLASGARVEEMLGKDRFDALVSAVGLDRFQGDEPIRGRLDARRADAEPAR